MGGARIGIIIIVFIISTLSVQAEISRRNMRGIIDILKQSAIAAAQYEKCGINADRLKNIIMDQAENCGASDDQNTELEDVYKKAFDQQTDYLEGKGDFCSAGGYAFWQSKLDEVVRRIRVLGEACR